MSDDLIKEKINKYFQLKAKYNEQKDKLIKNKYLDRVSTYEYYPTRTR